MRGRKMKNHEYRELVNTLTKIAREYGQTQQLRERIAHALPFDCDVIDDVRECTKAWVVRQQVSTVEKSWLVDVFSSRFERPAAQAYNCMVEENQLAYFELVMVAHREECVAHSSVKIPANPAESQQ